MCAARQTSQSVVGILCQMKSPELKAAEDKLRVARQALEDDDERMKLHSYAHQARGQNIILKNAIEAEKDEYPEQMMEAAQSGDRQDDGRSRQGTHDRNKLQRKDNSRE